MRTEHDSENLDNENDEQLTLVFMPPLVAILQRAEELKAAPLSETEVLGIRDQCVCVSVRASVAKNMEEARGYTDIDAENAWQSWQNFRRKSS